MLHEQVTGYIIGKRPAGETAGFCVPLLLAAALAGQDAPGSIFSGWDIGSPLQTVGLPAVFFCWKYLLLQRIRKNW